MYGADKKGRLIAKLVISENKNMWHARFYLRVKDVRIYPWFKSWIFYYQDPQLGLFSGCKYNQRNSSRRLVTIERKQIVKNERVILVAWNERR